VVQLRTAFLSALRKGPNTAGFQQCRHGRASRKGVSEHARPLGHLGRCTAESLDSAVPAESTSLLCCSGPPTPRPTPRTCTGGQAIFRRRHRLGLRRARCRRQDPHVGRRRRSRRHRWLGCRRWHLRRRLYTSPRQRLPRCRHLGECDEGGYDALHSLRGEGSPHEERGWSGQHGREGQRGRLNHLAQQVRLGHEGERWCG